MEEQQKKAWSSPPVDNVGYIPSTQMLAMSDDELRALVERFRQTRYKGNRNYGGEVEEIHGA